MVYDLFVIISWMAFYNRAEQNIAFLDGRHTCAEQDSEQTDPCQMSITGGLSKEFFNRSASTYGHWPNKLSGPNMPYNNEPHVALRVLHALIAEQSDNLTLFYSAEVSSVAKNDDTAAITALTLSDGRVFYGKTFVDSSYTGDLMAAAGVDYTVGREANTTYNESMAGRRLGDPRNQNNFNVAIDPYVAPAKSHADAAPDQAASPVLLPGLLSAEDAAQIVKPGQADSKVQSYNFRLCVTKNASNKIAFVKPDEYHPEDWELARRLYKEWNVNPETPSCNTGQIPNSKFYMNNCGPIVRNCACVWGLRVHACVRPCVRARLHMYYVLLDVYTHARVRAQTCIMENGWMYT